MGVPEEVERMGVYGERVSTQRLMRPGDIVQLSRRVEDV